MAPLNVVNEQKPRQIAARVLQQRCASGEFIEDLLEIALQGAQLSPATRPLSGNRVWRCALAGRARLAHRPETNGREQKSGLQNLLRLGLTKFSGSTDSQPRRRP